MRRRKRIIFDAGVGTYGHSQSPLGRNWIPFGALPLHADCRNGCLYFHLMASQVRRGQGGACQSIYEGVVHCVSNLSTLVILPVNFPIIGSSFKEIMYFFGHFTTVFLAFPIVVAFPNPLPTPTIALGLSDPGPEVLARQPLSIPTLTRRSWPPILTGGMPPVPTTATCHSTCACSASTNTVATTALATEGEFKETTEYSSTISAPVPQYTCLCDPCWGGSKPGLALYQQCMSVCVLANA